MALRNYETLLLFSPELSASSRSEILSALTGIIERNGGQMLQTDEWGLRELAYPVRKATRGWYVLLQYQGPAPLVAELTRNLRITDGVFKYLTVQQHGGQNALH